MAEDVDITFTHDIAGYQLVEYDADIGISPSFTATFIIPTIRTAGLTFTHDIAGSQTVQFASSLGASSPSRDEVIDRLIQPSADISITPTLTGAFRLPRKFAAVLGVSASFTLELNVGYTDIVMFGDLILRNGHPTDWDEISLSCREAQIWDGTYALEVAPVTGFQGKFKFYPTDYNDIYRLLAMVGTKQTLRVYGVPYRNCMVWGTIRKRAVRMFRSIWEVEIEIRQDTCYMGQTA